MDDLLKEVNKKTVLIKLENIGAKYKKTCKVCNEEFVLSDLIAHEKSHPTEYFTLEQSDTEVTFQSDDFLCSVCGETFQKETQLRIHQVQKHSSSLVVYLKKAPIPKERYCRKLDFGSSEHEEEKQSVVDFKRYKCRYCGKGFVLPSQCKSHENAHAESEIVVKPAEFFQEVSSIEDGKGNSEFPRLMKDSIDVNEILPSTVEFSSKSLHFDFPLVPKEEKDTSEKMETQTQITIRAETMQMPKLIAPIKLESIQLKEFSNIANFGSESISFVTNAPFAAAPIKFESSVCSNSTLAMVVKQETQAPSEAEVVQQVLTNGVVNVNCTNQSNQKSHECLQCGIVFSESEIFPHIKTHLTKGQKECSLCSYRAIASGDLRDHMNKHYSLKPYKCPLCPNSYGWQSGWKKHIATHDKDKKPFKCTNCQLRFDTQRERRRHELVHQNISGPSAKKKQKKSKATGEHIKLEYDTHSVQEQHHYSSAQQQQNQNYSVNVTYSNEDFHGQQNNSYYDTNGVYNGEYHTPNHSHTQNSWDSGQGHSEVSDYSSTIQETWADDSAIQTKEPNLDKNEESQIEFREPDDIRESETCKACNEVIPMSELPAHIRSHILPGQKACTICKYKCNTKVYLEEHYNIHYGIKPYTCTVCKRKFAMRSYLRSHTQQVHENESTRRYQCRYCNKRFVRPCHQRTHEKIHENQGEVLPIGESSTVNPALDSDSNSSSTPSQRAGMTPERRSLTSSPSFNSIHQQRSHTNSPQLATMVPVAPLTPKSEFSAPATPNPWPYWSANQNQYSPSDPNQSTSYGQSSWNNYQYYPLVKSDVNWTEPLNDSSPWQQQSGQQGQNYSAPIKSESTWGDSSSSGFHSNSNSNCVPPSASVQDLWTELHYEEMKWFPETSTTYTADGIPMITELAPYDNSFSYTDMLNSVTADLPLFGGFGATPNANDFQNSTEEPVVSIESKEKGSEKGTHGGWRGIGPRPGRNSKGRGKGRLTAEAKHKLKMNFVSAVPDGDLDGGVDSTPSSPKPAGSSGDDGSEDAESLVTCQSCRIEVPRRNLLSHIRGHLLPGQRTCDLCQRTYCNPMTLREHVHVHYNLKPHKCSHCPERFSTKYSLKTHEVFTHEEGKVSECPYPGCAKVFAMRSELHKHVRTHENKNGISLLQRSGKVKERRSTAETQIEEKLKEERINDAKSKTWEVRVLDIGRKMKKKCPLCNEEVFLADFYNHKYSHREPCHICGEPILCTEILYHGPTHVGSDMKCEICGWKAQQRSQLWEHLNGHMKVKPIRCLYCGVGFASRNSLRSHYLALHTNFRPHSCRYCDKTFVQGNTVKQHELTHFGTQCPACPESFSFRKDLKIHLREAHKFDY